ncbi:chemotaxis protein CheX [Pectobacterium betavasculorum]|uniref:Chemotaxis protein CheX n=1 Tax=Pectobacterium betavasculorum TaxID=55207 RepID=A0A093RJB4_9GAMM|nr:chlorinating enzyme [Pectobacterium betavasculorum]KFX03242.1 chemotaxis protein CheX [Pectobacterium betavasculorum]KFX18277.1 chemotaxis protein CheX [Pectobacterium betavasculorum]
MFVKSEDTLFTAEQIEQFNRDGVIGPFKLYEPEEAKDILHRIRTKNIDTSLSIHQNEVNYDRHFDIAELSKHIGHPGIVKRVRALMGQNLLCWRSEFFPKFPGSAATEWHQVANYQYATGEPLLESALPELDMPLDITVWTAFTDATKENGCMRFIPGSHKKMYYDEAKSVQVGRQEEFASVNSKTQFYGYDFQEFKVDPAWDPEAEKVLDMEMKPGECVIFSAKCVHASFPNTTKRNTRFAITARYTPAHVKVYPHSDVFMAHGGKFDLRASNYGPVLVSGNDPWGHNNIRAANSHNEPFPFVE